MSRDLPTINLLVTLYFPPGPDGELREEGFRESLLSWHHHLRYEGVVNLLVVNDGPAITQYKFWEEWWGRPSLYLGHERNGVGASWNQGLQTAWETSPLLLNIDDDWLLTQDYDLTPWAEMLLDDETIGAVHLSAPYPGCTGTIEPRKHGWVVRMNRHNLVAGLRACLYHKRFFDAYGLFQTGLSAWETERLFNEHFCQSRGPESVLTLPFPWKEGRGSVVLLGQVSPHA